MVKILIQSYLLLMMSVLLHEGLHIITGIMLKMPITEIHIGVPTQIGIRIFKKLFIAPFIISGFVAIDQDKVKDKHVVSVFAFFFSGILGNVLALWILNKIRIFVFIGIFIKYYNRITILFSMVPFLLDNDCTNFLKYLRNVRSNKPN